ncbi:unnamed protein product [Linum trigynum]|uniref:CCHC-type domain-containing protein n=1 Tax=Linum trigynum TaxID=586398 RepID=A0AAV2GIC6_9ROSI
MEESIEKGDSLTSPVVDTVPPGSEGDLLDQMDKFNIEDDDEEPLMVEDSDVDVVRMEAFRRLGLFGRLVAEKQPNIKSLKIALTKAWNTRKSFQITDLGDKLFAFQFLDMDDRNKACYGGPWHYENNIMVLASSFLIKKPVPEDLHMIDLWVQIQGFPAELRTQKMAEKIATRFGTLVWFDNSTGTMWDDYLRIRINLSINNPLKKKLKLNIGGELVEYVVKYEKLPLFCHSCGRIGHAKLKCPKPSGLGGDPFGLDMRTGPPGPRIWKSTMAKKEDAEIWEMLKKKFEIDSTGSNFDSDAQRGEQAEDSKNKNTSGKEGTVMEVEQTPLITEREPYDNANKAKEKKTEQGTQSKEKRQEESNVTIGALKKFTMGSEVELTTKRTTPNVWRRQEQKKVRLPAGIQITPQKRSKDLQEGEMEMEVDEIVNHKKAKMLNFTGELDGTQNGSQQKVDGDKADSVEEQSRRAQ